MEKKRTEGLYDIALFELFNLKSLNLGKLIVDIKKVEGNVGLEMEDIKVYEGFYHHYNADTSLWSYIDATLTGMNKIYCLLLSQTVMFAWSS